MSKSTTPMTAFKLSKQRYNAMISDVRQRVLYAVTTNEHTNPYDAKDKRSFRFVRELAQRVWLNRQLMVIRAKMGEVSPRIHRVRNPGSVRSIADLV